jgi:hypothetical protein
MFVMGVIFVVLVRHIGDMALGLWVPVCLIIVRVGIVEGLGVEVLRVGVLRGGICRFADFARVEGRLGTLFR